MSNHRILMRLLPSLGPVGPDIQAVRERSHRFHRQRDTFASVVSEGEYERLGSNPAVEIYPDVQLSPAGMGMSFDHAMLPANSSRGLDDVIHRIGAPAVWEKSRGSDTFVAVIDSGVCGAMNEFPAWKQAGGWSFDGSDPWTDYSGHGSMVACIAAATKAAAGASNGVAPDAKLYSCKTEYVSSQIISAYEWLMDRRDEHNQPIIANNSYAYNSCQAPAEPDIYGINQTITINHPLVTSLRQAIAAGITVVFAAGNNHMLCATHPHQCHPNSIWVWNSLDEILCVGTTDRQGNLWEYSSRGPGQWANQINVKPDCAAPTYGEVMWGCGYRDSSDGWGTSGASPLASGLVALLASQRPSNTPADFLDRIRQTCDPCFMSPLCAGHGVINCARAVY